MAHRAATMKPILCSLALGALVVVSSALFAAGGAADPVIGTWKLNTAKSRGAAVPKSETRTYAVSAEGFVLKYQSVEADGKESSVQVTYKYDGKDYPVTGSPNFDALSVKRIGPKTVQFTAKHMGKTVGRGMRTISKDGKTLTLITRRADAKGRMSTTTLVYDRR